MNTIYENLKQDLCKLYCKTQNKKVEELFIRLANADADSFLTWIATANTAKLGLQNMDAVNGLRLLSKIKTYSPDINYSKLSKYIIEHPSDAQYYGALRAIGEVASDPRIASDLASFNDIWHITNIMDIRTEAGDSSSSMVNKTSLVNDLIKIFFKYHSNQQDSSSINDGYDDMSNFKKKKETKPEKIKVMFMYLYKKFASELSNAARESGNKNLSDAIDQGFLIQPTKIAECIKLPDNNMIKSLSNDAKNTTKQLVKDISSPNENQYDYLVNRSMLIAGSIDINTYRTLMMQQMQQIDLHGLLGGKPQVNNNTSPTFSSHQRANSIAILYISLVLFALYYEIK